MESGKDEADNTTKPKQIKRRHAKLRIPPSKKNNALLLDGVKPLLLIPGFPKYGKLLLLEEMLESNFKGPIDVGDVKGEGKEDNLCQRIIDPIF
jgi:hypothetical protein